MRKVVATNPKVRNISAQNVSPELWELAHSFLHKHPTMHNRADLARIAIESYIGLAEEFGIDGDWRPKVPGVQAEIYNNAYKRLREGKHKQDEEAHVEAKAVHVEREEKGRGEAL